MRYAPFKTGTHGDMYVLLYICGNSSQETLPSGVQKQSVTPEGRAGFCHFHAVLACIGIPIAQMRDHTNILFDRINIITARLD